MMLSSTKKRTAQKHGLNEGENVYFAEVSKNRKERKHLHDDRREAKGGGTTTLT